MSGNNSYLEFEEVLRRSYPSNLKVVQGFFVYHFVDSLIFLDSRNFYKIDYLCGRNNYTGLMMYFNVRS